MALVPGENILRKYWENAPAPVPKNIIYGTKKVAKPDSDVIKLGINRHEHFIIDDVSDVIKQTSDQVSDVIKHTSVHKQKSTPIAKRMEFMAKRKALHASIPNNSKEESVFQTRFLLVGERIQKDRPTELWSNKNYFFITNSCNTVKPYQKQLISQVSNVANLGLKPGKIKHKKERFPCLKPLESFKLPFLTLSTSEKSMSRTKVQAMKSQGQVSSNVKSPGEIINGYQIRHLPKDFRRCGLKAKKEQITSLKIGEYYTQPCNTPISFHV